MLRLFKGRVGATMALSIAAACFSIDAQAGPGAAGLVTQDQTALRAAARESAPVQTLLWRGEALEIRAEQGDYLQVWDHHRERGGYVNKAQVYRVGSDAAAAQDLLAVLSFVRDQPGAEALGLALAAAAVQAAPADLLAGAAGASLVDAIGRQAERLADRASAGTPQRAQEQAALSAQLDVAARHGVRWTSRETDQRVRLCYDGDAFRRVLAMAAASAEQKARAALALTRSECGNPQARPGEREQLDRWRAEVLDRVPSAGLSPAWANRLALRRAAVWSSLAFARSDQDDNIGARAATERALQAMARVDKTALADDDLNRFTDAALRVNAVRWAGAAAARPASGPGLALRRAENGQTCLAVVDARKPAGPASAERCTWGRVWADSVSVNREGNAIAVAVQLADGWRELWVLRKAAGGWSVGVLPPAAAGPGIGYAEFAGWVPGGKQILVAREAITEGRALRRFEVMQIQTLAVERSAFDPTALGAFNRWSDAAWKRDSLALR